MTYLQQDASEHLLELRDITLNYGQFLALDNVSLTLDYARVHAVVGEHGAGKSSLGMLMSGVLAPDSGLIAIDGNEYVGLTVNAARKLGIEMVHQHTLSLNEKATVAENLFLATAPLKTLISRKKMVQAAETFLASYAIDLDPRMPVKYLNLPDRMFVDILKHLYARPKLLILDETLEKLSSDALKKIVAILAQLKQTGLSLLFITHRIDDIYNLADKVSIIKNGEILLTEDVKQIDKINLIKIAYTQISAEHYADELNKEFYQLLKYNEAILKHLPVNLIITDSKNRIRMVNDYCTRSFGLDPDSYVNVHIEQLFSSNHADAAQLINNAFSFHEEKTFYQVPITVNAINTISNIKTFPIYDGAFLIGNIIIIEDITEYDRLQKQVLLSEKLASVGLLAAGVAHEINNPLEIIYTHLGYLKYKFPSAELHEAIDVLHEQISSIANIVSNLHSFSDNTQTMIEEIDLNALIQNMLKLLQYNAKDKQITIQFEPSPDDLVIMANTHEIRQVILNLLKNSFEAMPSGGAIVIKTASIQDNGMHVGQLTFQDTGQGIGDENPNNIFLPFYSTKQGQANHLGLGLSVSYGIIKKYHGAITVENLPAGGCQFVITLPCCV